MKGKKRGDWDSFGLDWNRLNKSEKLAFPENGIVDFFFFFLSCKIIGQLKTLHDEGTCDGLGFKKCDGLGFKQCDVKMR